MQNTEDYSGLEPGSELLVNRIVSDNMGWATAIAKSVARAWNMDWQLDGLDGGAFDALLFCSRRFDPSRGVPFRAYARRRIHEAATQEARKSKAWQKGVGTNSEADQLAREISARLFEIFPELREGMFPVGDAEGEEGVRGSVRQMLAGASLVAAFKESAVDNPELALEYKELLLTMSALDPVHQSIIWAVYWQGQSMRNLAEEWGIDDLSIIREHKEILDHLSTRMENRSNSTLPPLKVRRGLRAKALQLRKVKSSGPFTELAKKVPLAFLLFGFLRMIADLNYFSAIGS